MRRRDVIKAALATGALYGSGGLPALGRVAQANSFPGLANRVLVNVMLSGGPDFRHLFPAPFDSDPQSYGYRYWEAKAGAHSLEQASSTYQARWTDDYFHVSDGATEFGILRKCGWLKRMWDSGKVAIISNAVGGTTRNHLHCQLIMHQGNPGSSPNDTWGWCATSGAWTGCSSICLGPRRQFVAAFLRGPRPILSSWITEPVTASGPHP